MAGWIKGNVDGASRKEGNAAGCGGVFRDSVGSWVVSFSRGLGSLNGLSAELWGIFMGIFLAWTKGFRRVCIETDSLAWHPLSPLISRINKLRSRDWTVELRRCFRESSNNAANWLASFALELHLEMKVLDDLPDMLKLVLESDLDPDGYCCWA